MKIDDRYLSELTFFLERMIIFLSIFKTVYDRPKMPSAPVLVFIGSDKCGWCHKVKAIWSEIVREIRKSYPEDKLRIAIISCPDFSGNYDFSSYPADLRKYCVWFPMFLLVEGTVWDEARRAENLAQGQNNPVRIDPPNVIAMNVKALVKDRPIDKDRDYENQCKIIEPNSYVQWLNKYYQKISPPKEVPNIEVLQIPELFGEDKKISSKSQPGVVNIKKIVPKTHSKKRY